MPDKAALPRARICHVSPGRVRVRIPERRYDAEYFAAVRELVSTWPGVEGVEVNPVTAGVLIRFAADLGGVSLADFPLDALGNDLFTIDLSDLAVAAESGGQVVPIDVAVRGSLKRFDSRLRELSGGAGDLRALVFVALLAGGFYQLFRGNIAAPAATLLWYAADTLRLWRDDAPAGGASGGGPPASSGDIPG